MDVLCDKRTAGTLIQVNGRMDATSAPDFEKQCVEVIEGGESTVVIDLSGLEYISSAGLRSLLASAKKAKASKCTMRVTGLSGMVEEVFQVSGLRSVFSTAATIEDAFAS